MAVETRWSKYKSAAPLPAPRPPEPWSKVLWDTVWGTALVFGAMAFMVFIVPLIKLAMFHWLAWDRFPKGDTGAAIGVFVFGCLAIDAGLILGAVLLARGSIALW